MSNKSFTHKDLSRQLGISETTIKSYRRKFPDAIPVASQGKPIRFTAEALAVCKRIRDFFDLGMSIPEIRLRLSSEFSWVIAEEHPATAPASPPNMENAAAIPSFPEEQTGAAISSEGDDPESRPDLPLIVGNLAKSLISLSQQQAALLRRMESLENLLREKNEKLPGSKTAAPAPEGDERLETRLEGLERSLEKTMGLLGNYVQAVQGLAQASPAKGARAASGGSAPAAASAAPAKERKFSEEYLRRLAALPLAHENDDRELVSLGDRCRGAYTLNDLKAVFAQAHQPPEHYIAYWHTEGDQSWFVLEQPESRQGCPVFLLVRLLRNERGADLALLRKLIINGDEAPPEKLYAIIQQLLG